MTQVIRVITSVFTLDELTSAIFKTVCDKGIGTPDAWIQEEEQ